MTRVALLLRGVNVGGANRIAMADFARIVAAAGSTDVRTLLNSGNAVCTTELDADALAGAVHDLLVAELDLDVPVISRTKEDIDAVAALNPLSAVATDPSRTLVVFLDRAPLPDAVRALEALKRGDEVWELHGRELHLWLPNGVARSASNRALTKGVLGPGWTGRNWATVLKIRDALWKA
ncbi:hypothetical protein DFJ74DRAFT_364985 [Hyaloraphidium curvatum]|nr:hypothetical protein DFJ74DRAFT_364985 [Hyaloraphidium curvatum]